MAEAPIQELSSANKIRELAGMPIEAQPAPRQEEPPAWSEIKDSEDYKTLTYPEQINLARQWGAETKQYAASLQDYTPEQDAQIDDFVNTQAVDVPRDVKIASGAAGLVKGSSQLLGGIAGGLGGGLVGGPVGAIAGGVGGAIAGGELAEAGLQKFTPNVARSREFAPGYAIAGEYAPAVVAGTVGGAQLVQAGRTLFAELGAKRGAEEMAKAIGVSAGVGAGVGTGVRGITGGEVSPGTIAEDALFGALFAGLGSGSRVKGYNREQAISLNERVKAGRATEAEYRDWNGILAEAQKTGARGVESAKRTTVDLAGRQVFEKTDLTLPKKQPMQQMPTAELPPVQPVPPVELAEAGVRGNVRGTQADTAEMQRRGIITPMQESLVDLNDPVPRTDVFTIESQGINREAITPDTRGLQGEIVSEGQLVTPRTQLPSTERLALPAVQGGTAEAIEYYHGTSRPQEDQFKENSLGLIFATPSKTEAKVYAGNSKTAKIIPVEINAKNIFDAENPQHLEKIGAEDSDRLWDAAYIENADWLNKIKNAGFDGIYMRDVGGIGAIGEKNVAVFDKSSISSKTTIPRPMRGKAGEAGFIVSDVQEGAAKVAKKWLTTEGNLPKEMFDIMESKGSRTQAMLKQIDFTLKDLAKEARILNGKPRLTPEQSGQLDQFLRGTSDVTILPEPFQPIASQMRRQLGNLFGGLNQEGTFSQGGG